MAISNDFEHIATVTRFSVVRATAAYGLDDGGSEFDSSDQELSLLHIVQTGSEAHPYSYTLGTGVFFSARAKRLRLKADHSPQTNADIKNNMDLYQVMGVFIRLGNVTIIG
jgi:hypothetical protein